MLIYTKEQEPMVEAVTCAPLSQAAEGLEASLPFQGNPNWTVIVSDELLRSQQATPFDEPDPDEVPVVLFPCQAKPLLTNIERGLIYLTPDPGWWVVWLQTTIHSVELEATALSWLELSKERRLQPIAGSPVVVYLNDMHTDLLVFLPPGGVQQVTAFDDDGGGTDYKLYAFDDSLFLLRGDMVGVM